MQFLHIGDAVMVIMGELHSLVATVTLVDHNCSSIGLELILDGRMKEAQIWLKNKLLQVHT